MAADVQWDKLEKQVYYCLSNEHLLRVDAGLCFSFIVFFSFFPSAQVDLFGFKNPHTAPGNIKDSNSAIYL